MIVNFEDPRFQVAVDEDVKSEDLETVSFSLAPPPVELILLLFKAERLHCEETLLTDFADLFKKVVRVNPLLCFQLLEHVRQGLLARLFDVEGIKVIRIDELIRHLVEAEVCQM